MHRLDRRAWPPSRTMAVAGCVLGAAMGLLLLAGARLGMGPGAPGTLEVVGLGLLGFLGLTHLVLAAVAFGSAWFLPANPRVHGLLLAMWGVLGLYLGFGFWVGSALLIAGGLLGAARAPRPRFGGRRPAL